MAKSAADGTPMRLAVKEAPEAAAKAALYRKLSVGLKAYAPTQKLKIQKLKIQKLEILNT